MTFAELQRALTSVEPAAILVPPRVMEAIIRQELQLSGMAWSAPHAQSWIAQRTSLFRHVDQAELVLETDQLLPQVAILLRWPDEEELQRTSRANILLKLWRQLFHASIHQAVDRCWDDAVLTPLHLRESIETIGPTAFEEIKTVLQQENILSAKANDKDVFNEFVAVYLELFHFSPTLLPSFFPGLANHSSIEPLLGRIVDSGDVLRKTRLPGAPEPIVAKEDVASEAHEFFHELEASSKRAHAAGNLVQAAIQLQRAVRVAPADLAPPTRQQAESILAELLARLKLALDLSEGECDGWSRLLPILLDKADQGSHPAEAALLHELQDICVDHEREMYKLDVVEYILSAGRRPLKRPLPSQRLVRITRTLRSAVPNLTAARLSDNDRRQLEGLLQKALNKGENRVRGRFRPLLKNAFQDVGLAPTNPLETVAFHKMIEELLDRVIDSGFLTFSDLRDTISRNQLKLPDLTDPQDFIRGDPLIRLDRRLATVLDGVYRPGEFYLRWLERFTSVNFGTKLGRLFTLFVTVPIGGAFLIVQAIFLLLHLDSHAAPTEPDSPTGAGHNAVALSVEWGLYIAVAASIFGLLHSSRFRDGLARAWRTTWIGLRRLFVDFPLEIARHEAVKKVINSVPYQLLYGYIFKPAVLTATFWTVNAFVREDFRLELNAFSVMLSLVTAALLINSRPGEIIWESILKAIQNLISRVHGGLIPGLLRFIVAVYKQILHWVEGVMFTVDEWLRFRGGESPGQIFIRSVATLVWMPISYILRFNLVVLIEPCFNPLKYPVCAVAFKFWIPFAQAIGFKVAVQEFASPFLGDVLAGLFAYYIWFWFPDVFGFIFWELKENWTLYRANRRQDVGPVPIGAHGETIRNFFQPGFHSGTLPKLFAKIRHAEEQALHTGNYSAVRQHRTTLLEVEETLHKFIDREFCTLLEQSSVWRGQALSAHQVELSSNSIRFHLAHPNFPDQPLLVTFENRAGWIVAGVSAAPWLASLSGEAEADLHNALVLLGKYAGVDIIREHIRSLLPSPQDRFDFTPHGLVIWPADRHSKEMSVDLRPTRESPEDRNRDASTSISNWDPERVLFGNRLLTRSECLACWPSRPQPTGTPSRLLADIPILPVVDVPRPQVHISPNDAPTTIDPATSISVVA